MSKVDNPPKSSGSGAKNAGHSLSQKAPKNTRVVKSSEVTGTISREAARAAVKELMRER